MNSPTNNETYHFTPGFLWGTATASYQVEGSNINNNWAAWEDEPGRIKNDHRSGLACDWWGGRWREDFDRAAETHQNAHRFSIEWSRIQPTPDHWDESALEFYRAMCRGLIERNIMPVITLHHFTDPLWLVESGGWENESVVEYFSHFVEKTVLALKDYCHIWCTINEPNVYVFGGYLGGGFPPGKNSLADTYLVMANLVRAHAAAYQIIHSIQPAAEVGVAINYRSLVPSRSYSLLDRWIASIQKGFFNDSFINTLFTGVLDMRLKKVSLPQAKKTTDFVGVNYYSRDLVKFDLSFPNNFYSKRFFPPDAPLSETGFIANVPEGFFEALKWANKYDLPIYVTENGVEDSNETLRPRYLTEHLHQVWRALNFNYPIKGYFYWTLVDNFEWERGWTQRFGLWGLDQETQRRKRRASVDLYAEVCKQNALSYDIVKKYAPESLKQVFPDQV